MFSNDKPISLKQFRHLALCQPYRIVLDTHFQIQHVIRLINNDFAFLLHFYLPQLSLSRLL